jgi:hypothetical protein
MTIATIRCVPLPHLFRGSAAICMDHSMHLVRPRETRHVVFLSSLLDFHHVDHPGPLIDSQGGHKT